MKTNILPPRSERLEWKIVRVARAKKPIPALATHHECTIPERTFHSGCRWAVEENNHRLLIIRGALFVRCTCIWAGEKKTIIFDPRTGVYVTTRAKVNEKPWHSVFLIKLRPKFSSLARAPTTSVHTTYHGARTACPQRVSAWSKVNE